MDALSEEGFSALMCMLILLKWIRFTKIDIVGLHFIILCRRTAIRVFMRYRQIERHSISILKGIEVKLLFLILMILAKKP